MALARYTGLLPATRMHGINVQPHRMSRSYDRFLVDNDLVNSITSRLLFAFYHELHIGIPGGVLISDATGPNARLAGAANAMWCNAPAPAAWVVIAADMDPDVLSGEITGLHGRQIAAFIEAAPTWMIELSRAHMSKPMSAENIASYFAMVRIRVTNVRPLIAFLDWSITVIAVTLADPLVLALTRSTTWGVYRTTVSSVVGLYDNYRQDYGAVVDNILGAAAIAAINALRAAPSDIALHRAIPQIAIAKIYVGLETSGGVPNQWYSGIRAVNAINNTTRNAWATGYRDLLRRRYDLPNIAAAANVDAVIDMTGLRHV